MNKKKDINKIKNRKTFRIEDNTWSQFTTRAKSENTNTSTLLREFIEKYLNN